MRLQHSFLIATLTMLSLLSACRDQEVIEPSFDVQASKTTVAVGEDINFKFSGNPNILTFYSGENTKEYLHRKRTEIINGSTTLQFSTTNAVRTTQENGFTVMVSTDYTGVNSTAAINAATWTDITSKVSLSTSATVVSSGTVDLNEFVSSAEFEKPLFIAFRYKVAAAAGQGTWVIKSFDVDNQTAEKTYNLANLETAEWVATNVANSALNWAVTPVDLTITGRGSGWVATEDWAITKPLYINNITPDIGFTIKDTSARIGDFQYSFAEPGIYRVTFVAANANMNGLKEQIKELTITVK